MTTVRSPSAWTASKLYRRTSTNERIVTILKLTHPTRQQRVVVVPCPRIGSESFYNDWAYQPYVKDHHFVLGFDAYSPMYTAASRIVVDRYREAYDGIKAFTILRIPGPTENDVTRSLLATRTHFVRTWAVMQTLTTAAWRDRNHKYVRKATLKQVGERYLVHPAKEQDGSFVFVFPPAQAETVLRTLGELGFEVSDTTEAAAGDCEKLERLEKYNVILEAVLLLYIYTNLFITLYVIGTYFYTRMKEFEEEYNRNRPAKIEELFSMGVVTREQADKMLSKSN